MKIIVKKFSGSFLHDLIKNVIANYPNEVIEILKKEFPNQKTWNEWTFDRSFQELENYYNKRDNYRSDITKQKMKIDVAWRMKKVNRIGKTLTRYILHEVKTGMYRIENIYSHYKKQRFGFDNVWRSVNSNIMLFVWGDSLISELNIEKINELGKFDRNIKSGVHIVNMELLFPLIYKALGDYFEISCDDESKKQKKPNEVSRK